MDRDGGRGRKAAKTASARAALAGSKAQMIQRTGRVFLVSVLQSIARLFVTLLAFCAFASPAAAAITFTLNTGNATTNTQKLLIDSNSCTTAGPKAAFVGGLITNTGSAAVSNITATMAGLTSNIYFAGGQPAAQALGTLGAGESVGVYWYVGYNCVEFAAATPSVTLSSSLGSQASTVNLQVLKAISANAGGLVTGSLLGPGAVVGQLITLDVTYSFGGTSAGDEFFLQPAGNQSFNAACFRLTSTRILPTPSGGTQATAIPVGTANRLYFLATAAQSGTSKVAKAQYTFQYLCANQATQADPYAAQTSGSTNLKYTGNFGTTPISYPSGSNPFTITKTASPASRTTADPAGPLTYTVTITNPSSFGTIVDRIDDQLPGGISFIGIAAGSDVTVANSGTLPGAGATGLLRFSGKIGVSYVLAANSSVKLVYTANPPVSAGIFTNTAQGFIGQSSTPAASASFSLSSVVTAANDSVGAVNGSTGAANVLNVFTGDTVGSAAASAANATLSVAAGSSVPPGLSFDTATGNVSVAANTAAGTYTFIYQICETANPTNCKTATVSVTVVGPLLGIAKSAPAPALESGVDSTYTITVTNTGTAAAPTAQVRDALPASLRFVSASGTNWTCANATGLVTCDFASGSIAPGGGISTIAVVVFPVPDSAGTAVTNYAAIDPAGGTAVPTPGPGCSPASSCASAGPDTVRAVTIDAVDDSGTPVASAMGGTVVADVLANDALNGAAPGLAGVNLTIVTPATAPGVVLDVATGTVTAAAGTPAGSYAIAYRICDKLNPSICDSASVSVTVTGPVLRLAKSLPSPTLEVGVNSTYILTVTNTGDGAATAAQVRDALPASLAFVSASGAGWSCGEAAGLVTCDFAGSIAQAGGNASIAIVVSPVAGSGGTSVTNYAAIDPAGGTAVPSPGPGCTPAAACASAGPSPIKPFIVIANDDASPVVDPVGGGTAVANVLANDALNGAPITLADVILTQVSSTGSGVSLDPATGAVSVAPGTPTGSYTLVYSICEQLNPSNCDNGTVSVTVGSAPVVATADNGSVASGAAGGTAVTDVLANDTLNGSPATLSTVTLTQVSSTSPAITLDPATGAITVAPGTPAGSYTLTYRICETLNPSNCQTADVTVTVGAAAIVATDDSASGASGATGVANAFIGDMLGGMAATASNATLSLVGTLPAALTFDLATGSVGIVAGTAAGTYTLDYRICEQLNPSNCDNGTVSVTVGSAPVVATADNGSVASGAAGGTAVTDVLANDTLNGSPATLSTVTLTQVSSTSPAITLDPATGAITVAPGTPAGSYTLTYRICETLNPSNCQTADVTVTVGAAAIVATDDSASGASGIGNAALVNVLANDTLGAAPTAAGSVILSVTSPASDAGITLDPATGIVGVAATVPAGSYAIGYRVCEQLNPSNCADAVVRLTVDSALSSVEGTVYTDLDGDRVFGPGEPRAAGWIVEILRNGAVVATTVSDAQGRYSASGLSSGAGYAIRFRNPENNVVYGVIGAVTLASNTTVIDQNQAIDPSGVVYNSVTRNPVSGAVVRLLDANGAALPTSCLLSPTQQGQTTGVSGAYRFDVVPGGAAQCLAADTVYRIAVTPPAGFGSPSSVLLPESGIFDPTGLSGPVRIVPSANPPLGSETARYFLTLRLAAGDPDILFNHLPVDPFVTRTPLVVTKTSTVRNASTGDLVPYTIAVRNSEPVQRAGVTIVDILPPGFKYVAGSARIDGSASDPAISDRELAWRRVTIPANGTVTVKLTAVIGAGVTAGDRINNGLVRNPLDGSEISNRGRAVVSIVASTLFDCAEIIGKVFDDRDGDGYQDAGEPGTPAARLATVNGQLITTDEHGRYHIACAAVPNALIGSNYVLKLDPRSVPAGYAPTRDNPQSIRLTRGKISKLDFGVRGGETLAIKLDARAFAAGSAEPGTELVRNLAAIAASKPRRLQLDLTYRAGPGEDRTLTEARLAALRAQLAAMFGPSWQDTPPAIVTTIVGAGR